MGDKIVLAFDVYGTLLSTASIAEKLSEIYGKDAGSNIAAQWRRYQLEYTWRLNSMDTYLPFTEVTKRALSHAVQEAGHQVSDAQADELMEEYDKLDPFPDVKAGLDNLAKVMSEQKQIDPVLFSNGTRSMVETSMTKSPTVGDEHGKLFTKSILIDDMPSGAKVYKPSRAAYDYLAKQVNRPMDRIWLISSNSFDIVGGLAFGLKTAWVDRVGSGWLDSLTTDAGSWSPHVVGSGLEDIIRGILKEEGL